MYYCLFLACWTYTSSIQQLMFPCLIMAGFEEGRRGNSSSLDLLLPALEADKNPRLGNPYSSTLTLQQKIN
jgi:hypothetical protein